MALKEMYDYLQTVTPDVDITLGASPYEIHPQGVIVEAGAKHQAVHEGDDESEERISFSDTAVFRVQLSWETLTGSEAGTIIDFYYDTAKGNARQKTFKWKHPDDGHTYVVRFDCDMARARRNYDVYGIMNIVFKVLGRIADA